MLKELEWVHSKLSNDEVMRIILTRDGWEITVDKTYIIDGVTVTGEDIKNAMIDSRIYRKHLGGDDE